MEELYQYLGEWGLFQTWVFFLLFFPIFSEGMQTLSAVIIYFVPPHRCRLPGWTNDSYHLQNEDHRKAVNHSIPMDDSQQSGYSQCSVFSQWNYSSVHNHSQGHPQLLDCQAWVYDTSEMDNSFITQFDLVCDRKTYRGHLMMTYFLGNLIGVLLGGYLCDWFGRKTILYLSSLCCLVVGVASAFPPSLEVYIVYRVITGLVGMAGYMAAFVLAMELVGPKKRTQAGSLITILWLMGPFFLDAVSFLVRQWHYLQIITVAPLIFCIAHWWLLPESPRWLLMKNKTQAALEVIRKGALLNKTSFSPSPDDVVKFQQQTKGERRGTQTLSTAVKMVKHPRMLIVTLIIFFNWCVVSMAYYGLSLNVGNLGGSLRINFFLSSTVELVGYLLAWLLLDRLGRKRSHCWFMLTAGLACLATIVTVSIGGQKLQWVTTALAMVGKLGVSASFTAVYLISAEIFPTVIRNFAMACSSFWARIGSTVSPYIADLGLYVGGRFGQAMPLIVFGGLAVLAGLSTFYLPETLHRTLPDTLDDAVNFIKNSKDNSKDKEQVDSSEEEEPAPNPLLSEDTSTV